MHDAFTNFFKKELRLYDENSEGSTMFQSSYNLKRYKELTIDWASSKFSDSRRNITSIE